ncbi:hypothetical protein OG535_09015 [Kitasatospora sp. NBC_00085]|uniref:hypothetical protein n=1 Tax=unclassified Kitasatospora TaxID=2633591 RepID=UPI0032532602
MEAEIVQLATSGATTLVGLMATEAWTQARSRLAALFGRGRDAEEVAAELEEIRIEVVQAEGEAELVADCTAELRGRLRRLLRDPGAAAELRSILDEFTPQLPAQAQVTVHNEISGGTQGNVMLGYTVNATLHQHGRPQG